MNAVSPYVTEEIMPFLMSAFRVETALGVTTEYGDIERPDTGEKLGAI